MGISLERGSHVGVIGGGPAGSLCAYFILTFAERVGLDIDVDVFEPRDFTKPGPAGCNMCGGIVSESLVQALAVEGINLPPTVVQRGIDSYELHTSSESVRIHTPLQEKRIAAVHRGGGPRDVEAVKWGGLDGYLLGLAQKLGAKVIRARVKDVGWENGRPQILLQGKARTYDLLVGAIGVNSSGWQLFDKLGLGSTPPRTSKTYVTELKLGREAISRSFGSSMYLFLLNIPRLDCAAIIPKGDYLTVCLLGRGVNQEVVDVFFQNPAVGRCFPPKWDPSKGACHCSPKINERQATHPFTNRVVLVGDCGVTRLYKDGIGAAYRTAKAAAKTAIFSGVSVEDFHKQYWPVYRSIVRDNRYGRLIFTVVHGIKAFRPVLRGVLKMVATEQSAPHAPKRMSTVLWDMFTGSAPYRETFYRTLAPGFLGSLARESLRAAGSIGRKPEGRRSHE
jgi:flavin-dependent dehydrogenase